MSQVLPNAAVYTVEYLADATQWRGGHAMFLEERAKNVKLTTIFELWQDGQLPEMAAFSVLLMVGLFLFALVSHRLIGRSRLWAA